MSAHTRVWLLPFISSVSREVSPLAPLAYFSSVSVSVAIVFLRGMGNGCWPHAQPSSVHILDLGPGNARPRPCHISIRYLQFYYHLHTDRWLLIDCNLPISRDVHTVHKRHITTRYLCCRCIHCSRRGVLGPGVCRGLRPRRLYQGPVPQRLAGQNNGRTTRPYTP